MAELHIGDLSSSIPGPLILTDTKNLTEGVALEIEGMVFEKGTEQLARTIEIMDVSMPVAEAVQILIQIHYPSESNYFSGEQDAAALEAKTGVHQYIEGAATELIGRIDLANSVLDPYGLELRTQPVWKLPFDFMPSARVLDQHTRDLIDQWGKEDPQMLNRALLSGLQVNCSYGMENLTDWRAQVEYAMEVMNSFVDPATRQRFLDMNTGMRNAWGETREKMLRKLLPFVKRTNFEAARMDPEDSILPARFESIEDFQSWEMAHSGVTRWKDVDLKSGHHLMATLKGDLDMKQGVIHNARMESRATDAGVVDTEGNLIAMTSDDLVRLSTPWIEHFGSFSR